MEKYVAKALTLDHYVLLLRNTVPTISAPGILKIISLDLEANLGSRGSTTD